MADTANKVYNENLDYSWYLEGQLTEAKEIIKLLLWDLRNRSYQPLKDMEQAEQFLKKIGEFICQS